MKCSVIDFKGGKNLKEWVSGRVNVIERLKRMKIKIKLFIV